MYTNLILRKVTVSKKRSSDCVSLNMGYSSATTFETKFHQVYCKGLQSNGSKKPKVSFAFNVSFTMEEGKYRHCNYSVTRQELKTTETECQRMCHVSREI